MPTPRQLTYSKSAYEPHHSFSRKMMLNNNGELIPVRNEGGLLLNQSSSGAFKKSTKRQIDVTLCNDMSQISSHDFFFTAQQAPPMTKRKRDEVEQDEEMPAIVVRPLTSREPKKSLVRSSFARK